MFVTGGTGYVGSAILKRLLADGHEVRCLVRGGAGRLRGAGSSADAAEGRLVAACGDLLAPDSYKEALRGTDAVVHLVGIIREKPRRGVTFRRIHVDGTDMLVTAAREAGVPRFVHMSALGARPNAVSGYHRSKCEAEERVRSSGVPHTIFRPSVIFGPGDEFVNMLAGLVKAPVTPVFGNGLYRMQPVSLHTVADVFAKALAADPAGETYEVGGPEQIPYNEMIKEIARALGRSVRLLHMPLWAAKPLVKTMQRFPFFPVTEDQLTMLLEENICRDGNRFVQVFGVPQIRFADGIREYLK
ncbi:complex I NDUFA9 subunit family protein [Gordoniibacillus kamchatkensis]|uniref:complex I NDUFA9 subunit family protein n=1 Tax=Gordoniibacillus kamchatkensis TaxID=1590651 RepID=UPI001E2DC7CD|nr:complex I NDUFA9 subunit family protein [Paenibacillus sp. VKM B-2647]